MVTIKPSEPIRHSLYTIFLFIYSVSFVNGKGKFTININDGLDSFRLVNDLDCN